MDAIIDLTRDPTPPHIDPNAEESKLSKEERKRRKQERRHAGDDEKRRERKRARREKQHKEGDEEHRPRREASRERDHERKPRRPRESSRERDHDRKRHRKDSDREEAVVSDQPLFFVDAGPAQLPPESLYAPAPTKEESRDLILPAHVYVFGETPAEIPVVDSDSDDNDSYIEYLDYDNRKGFVRYYEEEQEKRNKIVCKRCGAEDEHSTYQCTVLICDTCGARDDHPTFRCAISKTCFSCGMKGHINANCPNRAAGVYSDRHECGRCQSYQHQTSECPNIWRIYVYVREEDRQRVLEERKAKKGLQLGKGGEGYIADDEWCYNCGGAGHWGDDCQEFHPEPLSEPTAFSYRVLSTGPFVPAEPGSGHRAPREWEREVPLPGGVENVGRRGKKKEMDKLSRRAEQLDDASDDWFEKTQSAKTRRPERRDRLNRGTTPTGPRNAPSANLPARPIQSEASTSKVPLADRLSDSVPNRPRKERREHNSSSRNRNDHGRRGEERGPRYKGGYQR